MSQCLLWTCNIILYMIHISIHICTINVWKHSTPMLETKSFHDDFQRIFTASKVWGFLPFGQLRPLRHVSNECNLVNVASWWGPFTSFCLPIENSKLPASASPEMQDFAWAKHFKRSTTDPELLKRMDPVDSDRGFTIEDSSSKICHQYEAVKIVFLLQEQLQRGSIET